MRAVVQSRQAVVCLRLRSKSKDTGQDLATKYCILVCMTSLPILKEGGGFLLV